MAVPTPRPPTGKRPDIALFLYGATSGGAPRRALTLAREFAMRGFTVDWVVANPDAPLADQVLENVRAVALGGVVSKWAWLRKRKPLALRAAIPALARYLARERPRVLLSAANSAHLSAFAAHRMSRSEAKLALRICTHLTGGTAGTSRAPRLLKRSLARLFVPRADVVIAGSQSVAADLVSLTGIARERVATVYNPVVDAALAERSREALDHPWFVAGEPPVVLAAGRLVAQKDYPTLLRAFATLRLRVAARLVILGESKKPERRQRLLDLAKELGVADDVDLPGLVANPYAYMARARVFALSSAFEGLPGVLIEAMACGCPVVSTDSPGGSSEVLDGGRFGELVPVGEVDALAAALERSLASEPDRKALRERASVFSIDAGVDATLSALDLPAALTPGPSS